MLPIFFPVCITVGVGTHTRRCACSIPRRTTQNLQRRDQGKTKASREMVRMGGWGMKGLWMERFGLWEKKRDERASSWRRRRVEKKIGWRAGGQKEASAQGWEGSNFFGGGAAVSGPLQCDCGAAVPSSQRRAAHAALPTNVAVFSGRAQAAEPAVPSRYWLGTQDTLKP